MALSCVVFARKSSHTLRGHDVREARLSSGESSPGRTCKVYAPVFSQELPCLKPKSPLLKQALRALRVSYFKKRPFGMGRSRVRGISCF